MPTGYVFRSKVSTDAMTVKGTVDAVELGGRFLKEVGKTFQSDLCVPRALPSR